MQELLEDIELSLRNVTEKRAAKKAAVDAFVAAQAAMYAAETLANGAKAALQVAEEHLGTDRAALKNFVDERYC